MTLLKKTFEREVRRPRRNGSPARTIILTLVPADAAHDVPAMMIFREKGRRRRFALPVAAAYQEAVRRAVAADRKSKTRPHGVTRGLLTLVRES